jgi:hypothetical protein
MNINKARHHKGMPSRWYGPLLVIVGITIIAIIMIILSLALGVGPDPDVSIFLDQGKAP